MMDKRIFLAAVLAAFITPNVSLASAPACVRDVIDERNLAAVNDYALLQLVEEIRQRLADPNKYIIIYCDYIENGLQAWQAPEGSDLPQERFIIVNRRWLQLATRNERIKSQFLLAHEVAHHKHNDFRNGLERRQQELNADKKAACIVAQLGGSWPEVDDVLKGIRDQAEVNPGLYLPYEVTAAAAEEAFNGCEPANQNANPQTTNDVPERSVYLLFKPQSLTIESFDRAVESLNEIVFLSTNDPDTPDAVSRMSTQVALNSNGQPIAAPPLGTIRSNWANQKDQVLVFSDQSFSFNDGDPPIPQVSGTFVSGPAFADGDFTSISLPRAGRFIDTDNSAYLNLVITDDIARLVVGFAALKHAIEQDHPKDVIRHYLEFTQLALQSVRSHGEHVENFDEWSADLSHVDEILPIALAKLK